MLEAVIQNNKNFYPTPEPLIDRMLAKLKKNNTPNTVLEPSAGNGAIIERMKEYCVEYDDDDRRHRRRWRSFEHCSFRAIEIDEELQATLRGKGIKLIDTDFLAFSGPDKFDLIIGNPPFDHGDLHLMKAIEIMYCGEIVFLLNAETIRNPCTYNRGELVKKLHELNADIEYIQGAFVDAERSTGVEVALIYINIERKVEEDLFGGCKDKAEDEEPDLQQNFEVSTGRTIAELVAEYNQIINVGTETIIGYYKNYPKIWKYVGLNKEIDKYQSSHKNLTATLQSAVNNLLVTVRKDFWRRTLEIPEVTKRMTNSKRKEFDYQVEHRCDMDFTEANIRQFILNLIDGYEDMMMNAVQEVFKLLTKHAWSDGLYDDNIHYFNGWKTNDAFKVNKKLILPCYGSYSFVDQYDKNKRWKLSYHDPLKDLRDVDTVMNYFDAMTDYHSINVAVHDALDRQKAKKIYSTYFTIDVFKKGTIHLTFNSDNIWRRFNVSACMGKNWLPHDYGKKAYQDMTQEEKEVVNAFEGPASYNKNLNLPMFTKKNTLQIAA